MKKDSKSSLDPYASTYHFAKALSAIRSSRPRRSTILLAGHLVEIVCALQFAGAGSRRGGTGA
jgi:hypothetical protein